MKVILTELIIIYCFFEAKACETSEKVVEESVVDKELKNYVDDLFSENNFFIVPGIRVEGITNTTKNETKYCDSGRSARSVEDYFQEKLDDFTKTHTLSVNVLEAARFLSPTGDVITGKLP